MKRCFYCLILCGLIILTSVLLFPGGKPDPNGQHVIRSEPDKTISTAPVPPQRQTPEENASASPIDTSSSRFPRELQYGTLVHDADNKYPCQWITHIDGAEQVLVADHLIVQIQESLVTPDIQTALAEAGYAVREHWDDYYLIQWDMRHEEHPHLLERMTELQSLLPEARIEPDMQFRQSQVPEGEVLYPSSEQEDLMDVQWLYEQGYRADGVIVAVLDSGLNEDNPDLDGQFISGYDFVDDDTDTSGENSHGSAISAVIAANPDNHYGMAGLAPGSLILPVRILDKMGEGWSSDGIKGVDFAISRGASVINASWGGMKLWSDGLADSIRAFIQTGGVFVCAAGNDGRDISTIPEFPSSFNFDGMISVGGLLNDFRKASYDSNYSEGIVDILAPWRWNIPCHSCTATGNTAMMSGTSISTAIVSAFVSMAKANFSEPDSVALANRVLQTGILAPETTAKAAHPGYPNFKRMFDNFRPGIPSILSYSLEFDPPVFKYATGITFEVVSDAEFALAGLEGGYRSDDEHSTVYVSSMDGSVFTYRVYSINGYSWFGPFRLFGEPTPPSIVDPPSGFIEFPVNGPDPYYEFTVLGSRNILYDYTTERGVSYSSDIELSSEPLKLYMPDLPQGEYTLTLNNDWGETVYRFTPTLNRQKRIPKMPSIQNMIPFGDFLLGADFEYPDKYYLFDGEAYYKTDLYIPWNGMNEIGYHNGYPVFYSSEIGLTGYGIDGIPNTVPYTWVRGTSFLGVFDDKYLFFADDVLHLVTPESGSIETITFPFDSASSISKIQTTHSVILIDNHLPGILWKLGKDRVWSQVSSPGYQEFSRTLTSSDFFYFRKNEKYSSVPTLHYSRDGETWHQKELTLLLPEWKGSLFACHSGIGVVQTKPEESGPSFYIYNAEEDDVKLIAEDVNTAEDWSDMPSPISVGDTFIYERFLRLNDKSYDDLNRIPVQINKAYTTGQGIYAISHGALLYTKDFQRWSTVIEEAVGVVEDEDRSLLVTHDGTYILDEDNILDKIGSGFTDFNQLDVRNIAGLLIGKSADDSTWHYFNRESGEWIDEEILGAIEIDGCAYVSKGNKIYKVSEDSWNLFFTPADVGIQYSDNTKVYLTEVNSRFFVYISPSLSFSSKDGQIWQSADVLYMGNSNVIFSAGPHLYFPSREPEDNWFVLKSNGIVEAAPLLDSSCIDLPSYHGLFPAIARDDSFGRCAYLQDLELASDQVYRILPHAKFTGTKGWFSDERIGWFYFDPDHPSYIWSLDHGWLYLAGSRDQGYFFDSSLGWLFYNCFQYPNIYRYDTKEWLMYLEDSRSPRWFWSFTQNKWISSP